MTFVLKTFNQFEDFYSSHRNILSVIGCSSSTEKIFHPVFYYLKATNKKEHKSCVRIHYGCYSKLPFLSLFRILLFILCTTTVTFPN